MEDVYEDIKDNLEQFDPSNYKENIIYDILKTEYIKGKMEEEYIGKVPYSFYELMANNYAIRDS